MISNEAQQTDPTVQLTEAQKLARARERFNSLKDPQDIELDMTLIKTGIEHIAAIVTSWFQRVTA